MRLSRPIVKNRTGLTDSSLYTGATYLLEENDTSYINIEKMVDNNRSFISSLEEP